MVSRSNSSLRVIEERERDAKVLELRKAGANFDEIAAAVGYANRGGAYKAFQRALARITDSSAEEKRKLEEERLADLYRRATEIFATSHPILHKGEIVNDPKTGRPLQDASVALAALRECRATSESYRRLLGLDAATKYSLSGDPDGAPIDVTVSDVLGRLAEAKVAKEEQ